jgi:hypothetical protein
MEKGSRGLDATSFHDLKEGEAAFARTVMATRGAVAILHGAVAVVIERGRAFITGLKRMEALEPRGPGDGGCIEMFRAVLVLTCCGRPEYRLLAGLKNGRGVWALTEKAAARVQFPVVVCLFKEIGANCICANGF